MNPTISIIAAISENRIIGSENKLLWHIHEDMQRFKRLTTNHTVIMGRKTYESIGRALPNRINIIITRKTYFKAEGCIVKHAVTEALNYAKSVEKTEIFIIGGAQIYAQSFNLADKLYLTIVKGNFTGDAYFPDYSRFKNVVFEENHYGFAFLEIVK